MVKNKRMQEQAEPAGGSGVAGFTKTGWRFWLW